VRGFYGLRLLPVTQPADSPPTKPAPLFTPIQWALLPVLFSLMLWLGHVVASTLNRVHPFDCPRYWPFSVFNPRGPTISDLLVAFFVAVAGICGMVWAERNRYGFASVLALALFLVVGTNAMQGISRGFDYPVNGGIKSQEQYHHDAVRVASTSHFLRRFNTVQPSLKIHSRTHPPGAVLLFWVGKQLSGDRPALVGLAIALLAMPLTVWAGYGFFQTILLDRNKEVVGYATLLLALLPATQIYTGATLDAIIAALLLWAMREWISSPTVARTVRAIFAVTFASFLTFGTAWVFPVLFAADIYRAKQTTQNQSITSIFIYGVRRFALLLCAFVLAFTLLYQLTGYNHLQALRTASQLENPEGFRLLHQPYNYLMTRLENVAELAAFSGPFLLVLGKRGLSQLWRNGWTGILFAVAVGTLIGLFLTGAYHTGETARACLFVWPYLLLPVLLTLQKDSPQQRQGVLFAVFAQTWVMQLFGNWFW
jgi:hypothetical protein